MQDRIRLPLSFDVASMQADIERFAPDEWIRHFVSQNYIGDWSVIPLRGVTGASHPVMMIYADPGARDFSATPFLARCAYLPRVLATFQCELQAVRLMKLTPGSEILEHRDHDLCAEEGMARLHIPVTTNDGVEFQLNGIPVELRAGECWYLRLSDPHRVINRGDETRVHLVIDVCVNAWLRSLLA